MLQLAKEWIEKNGYNVYCLTEYSGGETKHLELQPAATCKNVYSVSKTFTATVIGILVTRGLLSVEDKISRYLKKYFPAQYDRKLEEVTVHHLLTHTMGQDKGYLFEADRYRYDTKDWLNLILSRPLPLAPGEKMVYTNSVYYLLSRIVEEITGKRLFDFLREELFVPMNFDGYGTGSCPLGHTFGASEMYFACNDLCKLGQMYLNGGSYGGREYLSESFLGEMHRAHAFSGTRFYGYSFWMNKKGGAYYGDGAHGQLLLVAPERNAVFAMQSYDDRLPMRDFVELLTQT